MSHSIPKILIVDDELDILEFLKYNFTKEEYSVNIADSGHLALEMAKEILPDLIILDVMMPRIDGIEVCRRLREIDAFKSTLIIFLTARGEDYSEISGFNVGADDYITKPIRIKALLARVKALLKRKGNNDNNNSTINIGNFVIDKEKRMVYKDKEGIKLPKMEFELLALLASKPSKVFSREEIYLKIWGNNIIVGDRTLDVHIRNLRKKIGEDFISTYKGIGYSFNV